MKEEKLREFGSVIQRLIDRRNLSRDETYQMFKEVLLDSQPEIQQGAFLAALVAKGETAEEIAGAWAAIDEFDTVRAAPDLPGELFENSGTGMDSLKTFNVSSAASVVAAACGVTMARHGARGITSRCGTVDVLEAVGIDAECDVAVVEKSIREAGIGLFNGMSAKVHPGALGRILSRIRFGSTLNIAASLAHPCRPKRGLRGVYTEKLLSKSADVMQSIGYERGLVVHGRDEKTGLGMDEISLSGRTTIHEFFGPAHNEYKMCPEDAGIRRKPFEAIASLGNPAAEAQRFVQVLSGRNHDACIDFTCLNAGAVLYTAGMCASIREGVNISREAIEKGAAIEKLHRWVSIQGHPDGAGLHKLESLLKK